MDIQYEQLVDQNARYHNRPIILTKQAFHGRLDHIIVADLNAIPSVGQSACRLIFGIVRSCIVERSHGSLDIHYYSKEGALEVVDITTIQCLIGRVLDRSVWATVDRSGSLNRPVYIENELSRLWAEASLLSVAAPMKAVLNSSRLDY